MTSDRAAQGWATPDFGKTTVVIGPNEAAVRSLIDRAAPEAIHVLCGYRNVPLLAVALRELLHRNRRFGMLGEGSDPTGLKGMVRRAMYGVHCRWFWHRFDFVLAMGLTGVDWFNGRGYPRAKLFPFAYVTEAYPHLPFPEVEGSGHVKLVFVGQCIRRKGLDLALRALGELRSVNWTLSIIGDGPQRSELERLAKRTSIMDRVSFLGVMPNESAIHFVASADLLILPSRFDGWGAVVNEALMRGVPVVCSDRCGAKDLVGAPFCGQVYRAGSVLELRQALKAWIARGTLRTCDRERIRRWSQCVEGRSVSDYFLGVMRHVYAQAPRPVAPWL
jgi:glycosyltransferase involved in cell wall biosynthesis